MSESIDLFIESVRSKLPPICTDTDLCALGFGSRATLSRLRKNGRSPSFLTFGNRKFSYLREDVISWIRINYKNNYKERHGK